MCVGLRVAHFVEFGVQGGDFGLPLRVQFEQVSLRSLRNSLPLGYQLLLPLLSGSHRPDRHLAHRVCHNVLIFLPGWGAGNIVHIELIHGFNTSALRVGAALCRRHSHKHRLQLELAELLGALGLILSCLRSLFYSL